MMLLFIGGPAHGEMREVGALVVAVVERVPGSDGPDVEIRTVRYHRHAVAGADGIRYFMAPADMSDEAACLALADYLLERWVAQP